MDITVSHVLFCFRRLQTLDVGYDEGVSVGLLFSLIIRKRDFGPFVLSTACSVQLNWHHLLGHYFSYQKHSAFNKTYFDSFLCYFAQFTRKKLTFKIIPSIILNITIILIVMFILLLMTMSHFHSNCGPWKGEKRQHKTNSLKWLDSD